MDNRRSLIRWEIKKEAKVWLPVIQSSIKCMVENMSLIGMRVSFDEKLPPGDPLNMSFVLSDRYTQFKTEARIQWSQVCYDKYVYGLSFRNISDEDRGKIYWYIQLL